MVTIYNVNLNELANKYVFSNDQAEIFLFYRKTNVNKRLKQQLMTAPPYRHMAIDTTHYRWSAFCAVPYNPFLLFKLIKL